MTETHPRSLTMLTLAAFGLALLMLFGGLGSLPLMEPDEGRNSEVAREMYVSGSWLVPTLNGNAYLDKPAFFFKSVALCFAAFGVNEGSARLPSALSGLGVLLAVWLFARRVFSARAAAIAVAVAATSPLFVAFSRIVIMDMMLALFVVAAIFCGALAEEYAGRARLKWLVAGAVAAGLATCVKGPVGFFLPVLVLAVWHFVEWRPHAVLRIFHPLPFVIFWAIALAWFIPLCLARPDFLHYGLVEETVNRVATNTTNRAKPWHFYAVLAPAGLIIWTILLPGGAIAAWRARRELTRWDRLALSWLLTVVIFFSLPTTKQPGYILTYVVPAALLVARLFDSAWRERDGIAGIAVRWSTFAAALLLPLAGLGLLVLPEPTLARIFNASAARMAMMHPLIKPVGFALAALGTVGLVAAWRRSVPASFAFFALLLPAIALPNLGAFAAYADSRSCRVLARALPAVPREADYVVISSLPSPLPFYLQREVTFMDEDFGDLGSNYILYTVRQTNETRNLVKLEDMTRWFVGQTNTAFVLYPKKFRAAMDALAKQRGATPVAYGEKFTGVLLPPPGRKP